MVQLKTFISLAGALLASGALAHPGGEPELTGAQLESRAAEVKYASRALAACSKRHQVNGLSKRNIARRAAKAAGIRKARGIADQPFVKRGVEELKKDHSHTDITLDTPVSEIFDNKNAACILSSDATVGPYYVDGELIRENIVNDEAGVSLDLELQVIDMSTCEPIPSVYVDVWHANSTGVYSGVVAKGNGNSEDESNWNTTAGRGIFATDDEGTVHFETNFPGHYTGRATHIHLITHENGEKLPNNTFKGGDATHAGQIFFDQDLITQVEEAEPYSGNTQPLTLNDDDGILQEQLKQSEWSPFVEYSLVGSTIEEGVLAWITLAVNREATFETPAAAHWTENGGVPGEGGGGPPGPPPSE